MIRTLAHFLILTALLTAPTAALADKRAEGQAPRGLGMDPTDMTFGDLVLPTEVAGTSMSDSKEFKFHFHGYLRAPFSLGFNTHNVESETIDDGVSVHAPPMVPDSSYLDWRFTNNAGGPWTELHLAYANKHVAANVAIAAYTFTDAGYNNLQAQLGINHAFVTLNYPELFGEKGGLVAHVGAFTNRYGAAGRYSAGKYETYLIGASHVAGENIRAFFDLNDRFTLHIEHGFGAKLEVPPYLDADVAAYLPYGGPEQQGGTMLHHAHLGGSIDDTVTFGGHYMTSWTDDADSADEVDGRITSVGGDVRLAGAFFGDGYLGYSHIESRDIMRVAGALEVLHSIGGWNLADNYYGEGSSGTGSIDSVLFQYTFSLARALWHPEVFYGQGHDLLISPFVMYNHISSDEPTFNGPTDKLKMGAEVTYSPMGWLGVSARYDLVHPDLDDTSVMFHVISPKVILRSSYISHEQIIIQYCGYINGGNVAPVWPNESVRPDEHVVQIAGVMWW